MLRRPATTLSITSEDVSSYEDRRMREMQSAATQARQISRQQFHAAMAARAEGPGGSGRRRTQERVLGQTTSPLAPTRAAPPNIFVAPGGQPGQATMPVGGGMQERIAQARARQQAQYATPGGDQTFDDSTLPEDMDVESDSGPEDSMLEARQQMQMRRAAVAAREERQEETPPTAPPVSSRPPPPRRTRDERIQGSTAPHLGGGVSRRR